jgi:hypothetical protein
VPSAGTTITQISCVRRGCHLHPCPYIHTLGYGGSAMWISFFTIVIAMAIFLNVAAVMMTVKSAKV